MIYLPYLRWTPDNWVPWSKLHKGYHYKVMVMYVNHALNTVKQFYCRILFNSCYHTANTLAFHTFSTRHRPQPLHLTPSFSANILTSFRENTSTDWNDLNFPLQTSTSTSIVLLYPLPLWLQLLRCPFSPLWPNASCILDSTLCHLFRRLAPLIIPSHFYLFNLSCPARYPHETYSSLSHLKKNALTSYFIPFMVLTFFYSHTSFKKLSTLKVSIFSPPTHSLIHSSLTSAPIILLKWPLLVTND